MVLRQIIGSWMGAVPSGDLWGTGLSGLQLALLAVSRPLAGSSMLPNTHRM